MTIGDIVIALLVCQTVPAVNTVNLKMFLYSINFILQNVGKSILSFYVMNNKTYLQIILYNKDVLLPIINGKKFEIPLSMANISKKVKDIYYISHNNKIIF